MEEFHHGTQVFSSVFFIKLINPQYFNIIQRLQIEICKIREAIKEKLPEEQAHVYLSQNGYLKHLL